MALKQEGHEVSFLVDDKQPLHRPEYKYETVPFPYPEWIVDVSPFPLWLVSNPIDSERLRIITQQLRDCDVVILNGYSVRFHHIIGKPHMTILTGAELEPLSNFSYASYCFREYAKSLAQLDEIPSKIVINFLTKNMRIVQLANLLYICKLKKLKPVDWYKQYLGKKDLVEHLLNYYHYFYTEITHARSSISSSLAYIYFPEGVVPRGDQILKEINADPGRRIFNLMVDTEHLKYQLPALNQKLRVFNVARFNWDRSASSDLFSSLDYKANDVMIHGIHLFLQRHPNAEVDIRFAKKGKDVDKTMRLCQELGLEKWITWLPELTQREVIEEFRQADIIFDQLGNSVVGMGGMEAMATGRPLIANSRPEIFEKYLGEPSAICHASTPQEVCEWLTKLAADPALREEIGKNSRAYVEKHFSARALARRVLGVITKTAA